MEKSYIENIRQQPLPLKDSHDSFICEEIIRVIPGKRLVAFGSWGGKKVVAKLFYGSPRAKKLAARDQKGVQALIESGIPTPALCYQGCSTEQSIQVLLFERIMNASNVDELWRKQEDPEALIRLLHLLTLELATQHVLGISQRDLHLKNFLVGQGKIYTLDGSDIEKFDHILERKESLESLALFISQLGVAAEKLRDSLFQTYVKSRSWLVKEYDYSFLQSAIQKNLKHRWIRYQKKIMRNCSAFKEITTSKSFIMCDRNYYTNEFLAFLTNPELIYAQKNPSILKNGRTATVIKAVIDGHERVIKRYNIKDSWHGLRRCLRPTRAAMSWRLSQYLCLMGIKTAKPIAFIENRFLGLRGKSYFIMENVDGIHLGDYFSQLHLAEKEKNEMAIKVIELFKQLAQLRLTHGDLKMTNILIHHGEPVLIDLDGMREHRCMFGFKRAFQAEVKRFLRNWENQPTLYRLFERLL